MRYEPQLSAETKRTEQESRLWLFHSGLSGKQSRQEIKGKFDNEDYRQKQILQHRSTGHSVNPTILVVHGRFSFLYRLLNNQRGLSIVETTNVVAPLVKWFTSVVVLSRRSFCSVEAKTNLKPHHLWLRRGAATNRHKRLRRDRNRSAIHSDGLNIPFNPIHPWGCSTSS